MGTIKDWIRKRKSYDLRFRLTDDEVLILEKALKAYLENGKRKEKIAIQDLLGIIQTQKNYQDIKR